MLRKWGILLFYLGVIFAIAGLILRSKELLAISTIGMCLGYAARDYFSKRRDSLNVMTVYAIFAMFFFGVGNLVGYLSEEGPYENLFFDYDVREYLFESQVLAMLGAVVPLVIFDWVARFPIKFRRRFSLPKVGFQVRDITLLRFSLILMVGGWAAQFAGAFLVFLGSLSNFIILGPNLAIFLINYRWQSPHTTLPSWSRWLPYCAMLFEASFHLMFSSLRVRILWPIAALLLPYVLLKALNPRRIVLALLLILGFMLIFKPVGELRGQVYGTERLREITRRTSVLDSGEAADDDPDEWGLLAVLARLSTFNQISQVVDIAEREGFYHGETLQYISYVFIPRLLWPEKPLITPGQWFAEKIGQGRQLDEGRFSNAINMTIPGELYLNFGWLGTLAGLSFLGLLYFLLWGATNFWTEHSNPLGQAFACLLLMQSMFNGSDVAAIIHMILLYLGVMGITMLTAFFMGHRKAATEIKADRRKLKITPPLRYD